MFNELRLLSAVQLINLLFCIQKYRNNIFLLQKKKENRNGGIDSIQDKTKDRNHTCDSEKKKTVGEVAQRSSCGGESTVYLRNDNVEVFVWA